MAGQLIGAGYWIAVTEICRACRIDAGALQELAQLGLIAPRGVAPTEWEFPASALPRLRIVGRLMRDLGVNASGAALAVELLEAQRDLERQIRLLGEVPPGLNAIFADALHYAEEHRSVIERFGRFPQRNAVLGRPSSPEEAQWLAAGGTTLGF